MDSIFSLLESNPVIAAVHSDKFPLAMDSPCDVVFCLGESIMTVKENIKCAHSKGKKVLIHIDLANGIGKDSEGVKYLSRIGCDGIYSIAGRSAAVIQKHLRLRWYTANGGFYVAQFRINYFPVNAFHCRISVKQITAPMPAMPAQSQIVAFQPKNCEKTAMPYVESALPTYVEALSTPETSEMRP